MATLAPFETSYARRGMVCSVDRLASEAGVWVLRSGGNAVDAAIAASAVLAVTTQHMCGMGGDLFALVHVPGRPAPDALNASGRAGSGADPDRLRQEGHSRMPPSGDIRSVPVPGCVDGWTALHERHGRLRLSDVLEPARSYATDGFPATPSLAAAARGLPVNDLTADYTAGGRLRPGDVVRRPGVARALTAVGSSGRDGFYGGEFGDALLQLGGNEYTREDLATPHADWVTPLSADSWGRRIWTVPPNSQGYLVLASSWIASQIDLPPPDPERGDLWAHFLIEATKQAGFDREAVLHEHADGDDLLAPGRLQPRLDAIRADIASPLHGSAGRGGTIYLCAVDADGMGVSLIQSNFTGWGSGLIVPELRIFLQNRGSGFSLVRGHPAEYGPRRRPPHTLAPALVTEPDGTLSMLLGTMGGDTQPHVLLQLLARTLVAGASPAEAVAAPRWVLSGPDRLARDVWHHEGPSRVGIEDTAPPEWFDGLAKRGHEVVRAPAWSGDFGHAQVIVVGDGILAGASDPRAGAGAAAGY